MSIWANLAELKNKMESFNQDFQELHEAYCQFVCLPPIERGEVKEHTLRYRRLCEKYDLSSTHETLMPQK